MYILGQHGTLCWGDLRIWAERGLIHIEDSRDSSYKSESVAAFLVKVKALNDMKMKFDGTESSAERKAIIEDRSRIQKLVEGAIDVAHRARAQGMPDDSTAGSSIRASRTVSVAVPRVVDDNDKLFC